MIIIIFILYMILLYIMIINKKASSYQVNSPSYSGGIR